MAVVKNLVNYYKIQLLKEESGQSMVEYSLIFAIVFLGVVAAVTGTANQISRIYTEIIAPAVANVIGGFIYIFWL